MFKYRTVKLPHHVYEALERALLCKLDHRTPEQVVEGAVKAWIANATAAAPAVRGYQWKSLFLPEGTRIRMCYKLKWAYADVVGDQIIYQGRAMSPAQFTNRVAGCVRNAWRELWLRCPGDARWHLADTRRRILRRVREPLPDYPPMPEAQPRPHEGGPGDSHGAQADAASDQAQVQAQAQVEALRAYVRACRKAKRARTTRHCVRRGDIVRDDQPDLARVPGQLSSVLPMRVGRPGPHDRRQRPYFPDTWLGRPRQREAPPAPWLDSSWSDST
ncbi:MAG: hypothetical protein V4582_02130 [Pseudomonadota bacterium]